MSDTLYGLVWYSAYEEYDIVAVFKSMDAAYFHCRILRANMAENNIEDEAFKVVPVKFDGKGWVVEVPKAS